MVEYGGKHSSWPVIDIQVSCRGKNEGTELARLLVVDEDHLFGVPIHHKGTIFLRPHHARS